MGEVAGNREAMWCEGFDSSLPLQRPISANTAEFISTCTESSVIVDDSDDAPEKRVAPCSTGFDTGLPLKRPISASTAEFMSTCAESSVAVDESDRPCAYE